ncbi:MAG: precorrin-2 C(20)-methyltransferase [Zhenhengia sp.]|jgi:precorrin-2/cobalt-factor-2 C20-methyltransferase|uniref:precorrin-2 C(20)-methyltransferase n=1 Tax=Zhenhengia sp. TaxID=2944208 RepID=UPI00290B6142|nr:precorrin-2 C(20)-methyltransferase [Clostridiales bacterium]MDU6973152.1 precorrin-2 C(20)-methyltransferase [Clostridiales bacterium]
MKGKLYGVGVGPGDPKLMTYKAVDTIQKCQVVAVPKSGDSEQVALNIAKEFIKNQTLIDCYMPMIRDKEALRKQHEEVASELKGYLDKGQDIAFLTLGDPTIYSTYMYIHRLIKEMGYETEIIPGISSICSVAAALNDSLCEGSDCLHIIPASYKGKEDYLDLEGTKVLMKTGKSMEKVKQHLKEKGLYERARAVECASMPNEKIHESLDTVEESSYFSIIVVKER